MFLRTPATTAIKIRNASKKGKANLNAEGIEFVRAALSARYVPSVRISITLLPWTVGWSSTALAIDATLRVPDAGALACSVEVLKKTFRVTWKLSFCQKRNTHNFIFFQVNL